MKSPDQSADDVITVIIEMHVPVSKFADAEKELSPPVGHDYVLFLSQYRGGFSPNQRDTPYYAIFRPPLGFSSWIP